MSGAVTATVPVGQTPEFAAAAPDGSRLYVTNSGSNTVAVVDTARREVVRSPLSFGVRTSGVAVSPDGSRVYVSNPQSNTVAILDTTVDAVTATVAVGTFPRGVVVSPDGATVYVVNELTQTVSVLDTATSTVVATISIPMDALGVAVAVDGLHLYAAGPASPTVAVVDTVARTVTTVALPAGRNPVSLATTPDGTSLWVASAGVPTPTLTVIDLPANAVVDTIGLATDPRVVVMSRDGRYAFVTQSGGTVSIVDTATRRQVSLLGAGTSPVGAAVTARNLYVVDSSADAVLVFDI